MNGSGENGEKRGVIRRYTDKMFCIHWSIGGKGVKGNGEAPCQTKPNWYCTF